MSSGPGSYAYPLPAQTKNLSGSLTDQLELYCDAVDAHLVVMGSQVGGRMFLRCSS